MIRVIQKCANYIILEDVKGNIVKILLKGKYFLPLTPGITITNMFTLTKIIILINKIYRYYIM